VIVRNNGRIIYSGDSLTKKMLISSRDPLFSRVFDNKKRRLSRGQKAYVLS